MRLDQTLISRILRFAEKYASPSKWAHPEGHESFADCDMDEVHGHVKLCEQEWMALKFRTRVAWGKLNMPSSE